MLSIKYNWTNEHLMVLFGNLKSRSPTKSLGIGDVTLESVIIPLIKPSAELRIALIMALWAFW